MRADPLTYPDVRNHHRRFSGMHRYRTPLIRGRVMAGHLPDPRVTPARPAIKPETRRFMRRTALQLFAVALALGALWAWLGGVG